MFLREALAEVADEIDSLCIDGAHRDDPVRDDVETWGARVAPGGTMLMHDAFNAIGVTRAPVRLLLSPICSIRGVSGRRPTIGASASTPGRGREPRCFSLAACRTWCAPSWS